MDPRPLGSTCERTPWGVVTIYRKRIRYPGASADIKAVFLGRQRLKVLSDETSRLVVLYAKKFVIKVDRSGNQAFGEATVFNALAPGDRRYFAATLYAGHWFTIQRYVKFKRANTVRDHAICMLVEEVCQKYKLWDISGFSTRQWGITTQGQPVIHDYGFSDLASKLQGV